MTGTTIRQPKIKNPAGVATTLAGVISETQRAKRLSDLSQESLEEMAQFLADMYGKRVSLVCVGLEDVPGHYRRMVENGRDRARAYDTDATLARWLDILNGPVRDDFLRWEATSALERSIRLAPRFLAERSSRRGHLRAIQDGPRILD